MEGYIFIYDLKTINNNTNDLFKSLLLKNGFVDTFGDIQLPETTVFFPQQTSNKSLANIFDLIQNIILNNNETSPFNTIFINKHMLIPLSGPIYKHRFYYSRPNVSLFLK